MTGRTAARRIAFAGFALASIACAPTHEAGVSTDTSAPTDATPSTTQTSLFSTARERLSRLERELAHELQVTLEAAPGVDHARVHLSLPAPVPLVGPSSPPAPAKAFALIQYTSPESPWSAHQVQELIAATAEGLDAERVTVVQQRLPPAPKAPEASSANAWVQVGPLRVQRESAGLLRLLLGAGSAAGLLLIVIVGGSWLRLRVTMQKLLQRSP